ncbi:MAG: hypothetical protein GVY02_06765 [Bacteroidetes bacterium]|jgi:archaellum component FlaF (FlaF/FlaG flagellin family)|nr:hypothetical protein [Bacteroidota bacterium]
MNKRGKELLSWSTVFVLTAVIFFSIQGLHAPVAPHGNLPEILRQIPIMIGIPSLFLLIHETMWAISQFGVPSNAPGFSIPLIKAMIGLALIFILAPILFATGYRKTESGQKPYHGFSWMVGAVIILLSIMIAGNKLTAMATHSSLNMQNRENTENGKLMGQLRYRLTELGYDTAEVMLLQKQQNESQRMVQLTDLSSYQNGEAFDFVMEEGPSDSVLQISGVTDIPGNQADFKNTNGEQGFVQVTVTITPFEDDLLAFERENIPYPSP